MKNFGEYQLVPLSAEEQQLVQEVSALYIFLPGFNSMLDIQAKDRQHMLRCHKNNGVRNAKTLITRPIMAVTSNFSFDHFSVFYVCLIWSFIILLRPPEHKKTLLVSKIEVNNGHFLVAMGYNGFFLREPLASMVFRWFCSPLTITINYFFNN